ncbi:MAG: hypothetical protein E7031_02485 [Akkermansiaceae bacterium]|nr:hypothetical protein [Akkermansiaceae bacterium]
MTITAQMIRAYATRYTREELVVLRDKAMDALNTGSVITQVATGSGTSYTRTITLRAEDALALYQGALDLLDGTDTAADYTQVEHFTQRGGIC